jgi:hypothetical protein
MTQTTPTPQPYALKFWYRPGAVVRALIDAGQGHGIALLVGGLFGFVQAIRVAMASENSVLGVLFAGAALGVLAIYLFSWLLRNFGRWFGAQAQVAEVRTALGLGLLPWTLLFAGFSLILNASSEAAEAVQWIPFLSVFFVYGYVILVLSLSAALRLSVLKTFLCLVVTFVVSLFPMTLVAQLVLQRL